MSYAVIRLMIIIATMMRYKTTTIDVSSAYLHAMLDEPVYVYPPPGFEHLGKVLRLKRALYGLRQSAAVWQKALNSFLVENGYRRSAEDDCMYVSNPKGITQPFTSVPCNLLFPTVGFFTISTTVDDLVIVSQHDADLTKFLTLFKSRFDFRDRGYIKEHVGFTVTGRTEDGEVKISQPRVVDQLLKLTNLTNCNPAALPADNKVYAKHTGEPINMREYMSLIGILNWLVTISRPEIANTVRALSQHQQNPGPEHWDALLNLVRYLKGSRERGVIYRAPLGKRPVILELMAASDAGGGREGDGRFISGWLVGLKIRSAAGGTEPGGSTGLDIGNIFDWKSHKQRKPARGLMDAEATAHAEVLHRITWWRKVFSELGFRQENPTEVLMDNQPLDTGLSRTNHISGLEHMSTSDYIIYDRHNEGISKRVLVPGTSNPADILTKPLQKTKFQESLRIILGERMT